MLTQIICTASSASFLNWDATWQDGSMKKRGKRVLKSQARLYRFVDRELMFILWASEQSVLRQDHLEECILHLSNLGALTWTARLFMVQLMTFDSATTNHWMSDDGTWTWKTAWLLSNGKMTPPGKQTCHFQKILSFRSFTLALSDYWFNILLDISSCDLIFCIFYSAHVTLEKSEELRYVDKFIILSNIFSYLGGYLELR